MNADNLTNPCVFLETHGSSHFATASARAWKSALCAQWSFLKQCTWRCDANQSRLDSDAGFGIAHCCKDHDVIWWCLKIALVHCRCRLHCNEPCYAVWFHVTWRSLYGVHDLVLSDYCILYIILYPHPPSLRICNFTSLHFATLSRHPAWSSVFASKCRRCRVNYQWGFSIPPTPSFWLPGCLSSFATGCKLSWTCASASDSGISGFKWPLSWAQLGQFRARLGPPSHKN